MINQLYINTNKKITHTLLLKCIYVIDNELTLRSSLNYYYSFVYFFGRFKCRNLFNVVQTTSSLPLQRFGRTFEEFAEFAFSVLKQKYPTLQQETGVCVGI